jgi:hypothetical protein
MPFELGLLISFLLSLSAAHASHAQDDAQALPIASAPGKSLSATCGVPRVTRSFASGGIQSVILRAVAAIQAEVVVVPSCRVVTISRISEGEAVRYHPVDPN